MRHPSSKLLGDRSIYIAGVHSRRRRWIALSSFLIDMCMIPNRGEREPWHPAHTHPSYCCLVPARHRTYQSRPAPYEKQATGIVERSAMDVVLACGEGHKPSLCDLDFSFFFSSVFSDSTILSVLRASKRQESVRPRARQRADLRVASTAPAHSQPHESVLPHHEREGKPCQRSQRGIFGITVHHAQTAAVANANRQEREAATDGCRKKIAPRAESTTNASHILERKRGMRNNYSNCAIDTTQRCSLYLDLRRTFVLSGSHLS